MCLQQQKLQFVLQIVHKTDKYSDNKKPWQWALQRTVVYTLANSL